MRFIVFFLFLSIVAAQAFSQTVSNVVAAFDGDKIIVTYDLEGTEAERYLIIVHYSTDDKDFTRVPKLVSGDVGANQIAGTGKVFTWDVKKELSSFTGSIRFKIESEPIVNASPNIEATEGKTINRASVENEHFSIQYVSSKKTENGFSVVAVIQARARIKALVTTSSYTVDERNKIYRLTSAKIAGRDILNSKYEFFTGVSETVELNFENKFVTDRGSNIKGFAISYSQGTILLNLR